MAAELRKVADALDKEPEAEMCDPLLSFAPANKTTLVNLAKLLPRPIEKSYQDFCGTPTIQLDYKADALRVWVKADRDIACRIIRHAIPAQYDCEPLLSTEEDEALVND